MNPTYPGSIARFRAPRATGPRRLPLRPSAIVERARTTLPEGTFAVGAGLVVSGLTTYVYVIITLNALGNDNNAVAGFSALWGVIFVAGLGLFQPLEQEVARAVAHRNAQGIGGGPVIRKAVRFGAVLAAVVTAITLACWAPLTDNLFHGQSGLVLAFIAGLLGYACMHLARGALSGNGRFGPYGFMLGFESVARLVAAGVFAVLGVASAAPYALLIGLAPFVAVLLSMRGQHGLAPDGPPAPWAEIAPALGFLLVGSVASQALAYASLLAINLLSHGSADKEVVAAFTSAFFLARVPVIMFMAVQAALLPKLAKYTGAGRHRDFKAALRQLVLVVSGVALLGVVLAYTLGPTVGELLFKKTYDPAIVTGTDLALLAGASGALIFALTLAQALIALDGHARVMWGWLAGVAGFFVGLSLSSDLLERVEIGFLLGSAVAAALMAAFLWHRIGKGLPASALELVEQLEHEPLEI